MFLGELDHRGGVVANRFELAPMAYQAPVTEQRLERFIRHRPYPARLETLEDFFEGRPFGVDEAVLEAGAKDPERHLRKITVVSQRFEFCRRARLGQACF